MTLQTTLIVLGVCATIAFGAGWKLRDYQVKADEAAALKGAMETFKTVLVDKELVTIADADKSQTLEELIAAMQKTKATVQIVREKEYVSKPVYNSCVVPDNGVQLINGRIADRKRTSGSTKRQNQVP